MICSSSWKERVHFDLGFYKMSRKKFVSLKFKIARKRNAWIQISCIIHFNKLIRVQVHYMPLLNLTLRLKPFGYTYTCIYITYLLTYLHTKCIEHWMSYIRFVDNNNPNYRILYGNRMNGSFLGIMPHLSSKQVVRKVERKACLLASTDRQ